MAHRATQPPTGTAPDPRALPALYRLAALAVSADGAATALRQMLTLLAETFHADAGSLSLLNPDSGHLETEIQFGLASEAPSAFAVKPGHGVTGWCALNHRALLVPDVTVEPRYIAVRAATRCELASPLLDGDHVVGVIDLESDRVGGFSAADLTLLEQLAAEAARVLQRLWQISHLQSKARQLESLLTAGQSLVTKLEPQELFDTLTREARRVMNARVCALYLHDAARRTIRCASLAHDGAPQPPAAELDAESCLVSSAFRTRRQVWFADVQSPEFRELLDLPADPAVRSVLTTPLISTGEVLGMLAIFTDRVHRFDNDEKRLCATLAGLGTVALENARLYARAFQSEDVLRKNERLTTLGLLAAEIAHEIRNPLTVLKLLHGGLGLDFPAGDPRRTDMRVIDEKLDQLEAIVTRVLGFAQAPSSLHSRWALADIVADTLVLVRPKLAQSKVTVSVHAAPAPLVVDAHKGQIQQVLLNLLINAMHAMPAGGKISLTLATAPRAGADVAFVDIADTGTGVDPAIRQQIFDSFFSDRPDGTGLGLAIAKRILISHHGDIAVLATSPAGTTMRITLPLAR